MNLPGSRLIRGAGRTFRHLGFHIAGRCNICGTRLSGHPAFVFSDLLPGVAGVVNSQVFISRRNGSGSEGKEKA
jgi:hypothetical protein